MIPSALAMAFLSPFAGRLYDKMGIKKMTMIGALLGLITAVPMFFYNAQTSLGWLLKLKLAFNKAHNKNYSNNCK